MKLYIMLIKPHSNSSRNIYWSKTKGYIHNINDTEVFDEQYIEDCKNFKSFNDATAWLQSILDKYVLDFLDEIITD